MKTEKENLNLHLDFLEDQSTRLLIITDFCLLNPISLDLLEKKRKAATIKNAVE